MKIMTLLSLSCYIANIKLMLDRSMDYMYVVDAAVCINIAPELKKMIFQK